jgi:hypothetical protein
MEETKIIIPNAESEKVKKFQLITLEFEEEGTMMPSFYVRAIVHAFCDSEEKIAKLRLKNVTITKPQELPENLNLEKFESNPKN